MVDEQRPDWKQILWARLYDAVNQRWGRRGLLVLSLTILSIVVGFAIYKLWPAYNNRDASNLKPNSSQIYPALNPKEHYLLSLFAKFQRDNGLESIAITAHGLASPNLTRAEAKQPLFDFRTKLFGPPGPVSDNRPEFQIFLQNIPVKYLRHYKTNDSSFWISVTEEGYSYLEKYKD